MCLRSPVETNPTKSQSLRYTVLMHGGIEEPHYDIMVETLPGSSLATWRSPVWPVETVTGVTRLKDHRRLYLDYEGDLSGGRGWVQRVGAGNCSLDIGEGNRWTMRAVTGGAFAIELRQLDAESWEAAPV